MQENKIKQEIENKCIENTIHVKEKPAKKFVKMRKVFWFDVEMVAYVHILYSYTKCTADFKTT